MKRRTSKRHLLLTLMVCACTKVTHAQSCDPHWSDQFPAADLDSSVSALATFDDGQGGGPAVYAGGSFTTGGDVALNHIGKLQGNTWVPLDSGTDRWVFALGAFDDASGGEGEFLIAGGDFTTAGNIQASHIAKWDGTTWSPMGAGLNEIVRSLQSFDDGSGEGSSVYAAGSFTESGNAAVNYIARWDGTNWMPLGDGLGNAVAAMAVFDDGSGDGPALFVGGFFTNAGGGEVNFIARWDGERWSAVGKGMDSAVRALVVFDDGSGPALYAGGNFTTAGGVAANRIAKWNGLSWSASGAGVDGPVWALSALDDRSGDGPALYAGGFFTEAGGIEANHVAKWDGSEWTPLEAGTDWFVTSFSVLEGDAPDESALYVGGAFDSAGEIPASNFAKWDGLVWSTTGNGMAGEGSLTIVIDFESFDDGSGDGPALYAGGIFGSAGGEAAKAIARWDGSEWSPVGGGIPGTSNAVFDVFSFDDGSGPALYAGGFFQSAGGVAANNVAKWDGAEWFPLGAGADGIVRAFASYDDGSGNGPELYIAGRFETAGGLIVNNVARWDGSQWSALGDGITGGKNVHNKLWSMTVFDDGSGEALYVSGNFTTAGGIPASGVARWDGISWSPVGLGFPVHRFETVYALVVYDDGTGPSLYAGGSFDVAGKVEVNGLARWDGKEWSPVGGGTDGVVVALDVFDDGIDEVPALYAGGIFFMAGNVAANHIARWNGRNWSSVGAGMGGDIFPAVWALRSFDDGSGTGPALFAGGEFTTAGGQSSSHIAKWIVCPSQVPGDLDGDGTVDKDDLAILLASWGPCDDCDDCPADLDDDCTVGVIDLLILLGNWG